MSVLGMCDQCEEKEATHYIATPRPSDPREIVSVLYVCGDCGGDEMTDLEAIGASLRGAGYIKVTGEVMDEFIESKHAGQILWITL